MKNSAIVINFITSNSGKVASMRRHLADFGVIVTQAPLHLIEPQADTVEEIALSKARQAYEQLHAPLVVEDSAFCIEELNGFPGPYIKYTLQTVGIEGILRMSANLQSRRCYFAAALVYIDEHGAEHVFADTAGNKGELATAVAPQNRDEAWSDLWRIYIADGTDKPLSALSPKEYERIQTDWQARSRFRVFGEWLQKQAEGAGQS